MLCTLTFYEQQYSITRFAGPASGTCQLSHTYTWYLEKPYQEGSTVVTTSSKASRERMLNKVICHSLAGTRGGTRERDSFWGESNYVKCGQSYLRFNIHQGSL